MGDASEDNGSGGSIAGGGTGSGSGGGNDEKLAQFIAFTGATEDIANHWLEVREMSFVVDGLEERKPLPEAYLLLLFFLRYCCCC